MILSRLKIGCFAVLILLILPACGSSDRKPVLKFPPLFTLTGVFETGKEPSFLVTEDFNADGNLDLMVSNSGGHTISYFKGQGDGTFKDAITLRTGADPICIAVGDFNNDQLLDFVELNYQDQTIQTFLNTGVTFRNTGLVLKPGRIPINLTVDDFNEDGLPDIAVSLRFHKVVFLWGKGNGHFSEPVAHPVKGQPTGLVTGDYNQDQHRDLAVALAGSGNRGVQVFWGDGRGGFDVSKLIPGGGQPLTISNIDANGDGLEDLVTSSNSLHALTLILNQGNKTFKTLPDFSAGEFPKFIVGGDFTGDGAADLAVSNATNDTVSVVVGYGDGTFSFPAIRHRVEEYPQGLVAGDFNKDGKQDLAVSCRDKNRISILIQRNLPRNKAKAPPRSQPS